MLQRDLVANLGIERILWKTAHSPAAGYLLKMETQAVNRLFETFRRSYHLCAKNY